MHPLDKIQQYFWPIFCGVLVAILVSVFFNPWLSTKTSSNVERVLLKSQNEWNGPVSYASAAKRASPSVVNIYTSKKVITRHSPLLYDPILRKLFSGAQQNLVEEQKSLGSGVIISSDGYILTNAHVIEAADKIIVMQQDGQQGEAEVLGIDNITDLAVLKVKLDNMTGINIGNPNSIQVGDVVLAIGNPHNFGQSVTQGIISATGRTLIQQGPLVNYLQTDAVINEGNSGGALVDAFGNLLGINSRKLGSENYGLSFAVPADIALIVVKDILEHGKVLRGWLGVSANAVLKKQLQQAGIDAPVAMEVYSLASGGPAFRAGLSVGDLIIGMNGRELLDGRRIVSTIANAKPGDQFDFKILRREEQLNIKVTADERPE